MLFSRFSVIAGVVVCALASSNAVHASVIDDYSVAQGAASITFAGRNQVTNNASPWAPFDATVRSTFAQNFAGSGSDIAASSSISGGSLDLVLKSGLGASGGAGVAYSGLWSNLNGDRFSVTYTYNSSATNVALALYLQDSSSNVLSASVSPAPTGASITEEVLFSSLSGSGAFNWNAVTIVAMYFNVTSGTLDADQSISVDSFGVIPAPGAMALLGLAGVVGSRRRK